MKAADDAIDLGIVLIPEDRIRQGVVVDHSVASNICLPVLDRLSTGTWVSNSKARSLADQQIAKLRIKTASRDSAVRSLSGGNQQKVVLAKWLAADPDVLVLDEPTAGIDIGSKSEIIALVRDLARAGKAIILISSELMELLAASDRILLMSEGRVTGEIAKTRPHGRRGPSPSRRCRAAAPGDAATGDMSESGDARATVSTSRRILATWRQNIIYLGFVAIFLFFAITLHDKGFLEPTNLLNIVRQTAVIAVMAVAMTFVLSAGEIDLSVGALAGLASVATAMAIDLGGPFFGILGGLATGFAVGVANGIITTRIGIPSFLTTLAMMGIARGVAMWVSDTRSIPIVDRNFPYFFGGGDIGPVPTLLIWMLLIGAIGHVVLRRTTFGRRVLATGGNEVAARFSGIDTRSIKFRALVDLESCGGDRRDALCGTASLRPLPVRRGRRALGDRSSGPGWHQPLRRKRHGRRIDCRRADDRSHQ